MLRVDVLPGSPAAQAGLRGPLLLHTLDGRAIADDLDYRFGAAGEELTAVVDSGGGRRRVVIRKPYDADPGFLLPPLRPRVCGNRCVFCFVSQHPPRVRAALRLRDEDYRLSFLLGNYVTLTNLAAADWRRIARLRLSPLYVSVHATDERVRRTLLGNPRAPALMPQLRRLARLRLQVHTQVVICPGLNDGAVLAQTLRDLARLRPCVASVALVPVGLTAHRARAFPLRPLTADAARAVLALAHRYDARLRPRTGEGWVYPADELYHLAGEPFPRRAFYDDVPQLENGVGMARRLLDRLPRLRLPGPHPHTVLTGELAAPLLARWAARTRTRVIAVPNRWFGGNVNVAGLLAGRDLLPYARQVTRGTLFIPGGALNADGKFVDDLPLAQLAAATRAQVRCYDDTGEVTACAA